MLAHIIVTPETTEEEVLELLRREKATLEAHKRQNTLWEAEHIVAAYKRRSVLISSADSLSILRRRIEQLPPREIERRRDAEKAKLPEYENFESTFFQYLNEQKPANWGDSAGTEEEYLALSAEKNRKDLEIVKAAIPYMQEIVKIYEEILNKKLAFVEAHKNEVPDLIKDCKQFTREAEKIQRKVNEILTHAYLGLTDKEIRNVVSEVLRHKELLRLLNAASGKLALYMPDNPNADLPSFPSLTSYNLPLWLQIKIEQAEREREKK